MLFLLPLVVPVKPIPSNRLQFDLRPSAHWEISLLYLMTMILNDSLNAKCDFQLHLFGNFSSEASAYGYSYNLCDHSMSWNFHIYQIPKVSSKDEKEYFFFTHPHDFSSQLLCSHKTLVCFRKLWDVYPSFL